MTRRWASWAIASLLFAASVAWLARVVDPAGIAAVWRSANLGLLLGGSIGTHLVYWGCRASRWSVVLRATGHPEASPRVVYPAVAVSLAVANVTPGQVGEALKVELLRRRMPLGRGIGYGGVLVERVADAAVLLALGGVGTVGAGLAGRVPLGSLVALLVGLGLVAAFAVWAVARWVPAAHALAVRLGASLSGPGDVARILVWTVLGWLTIAAMHGLSYAAVGLWLDPFQVLAVLSLGTFANLLSMVPAGLGVADVATIELLRGFGADPAVAQAGALAIRVNVVVALGLAGLQHAIAGRSAPSTAD